MIVARYEHGTLHVIDRLKEMVRLAAGVKRSGELDGEVEARALDCLSRFGQRIRALPAARVRAVGTNAMRRMKDGWRFLTSAEARLGHPIEIVSGQEEARLIYLGVAHGIAEQGNQRLVIDIGGGSTEFIIGRDFSPIVLESLYFGSVSLAQAHFADGRITAKRWERAARDVGMELQRIASEFRQCGWSEVLGCSGTFKAVRDVVVAQGFSERGITQASMRELEVSLLQAGHVDRIALAGLSDRRRPVFPSGAVIVKTCLDQLGIDTMLVTDYALREGLLYDMLGRILHADPRHGSVHALIERYRVDRDQGERVRALAWELFDQVAGGWCLDGPSRELLGWAAELHELGLTISHHGYHRHGAYLLENSDLPGFSRLDQLVLATLVGNHRRKPDPACFRRLIARIQTTVTRIGALLRLAVLFHRTRTNPLAPPIRAAADGATLTLRLPEAWWSTHPLTAADLEQEAGNLRRLGITLELA